MFCGHLLPLSLAMKLLPLLRQQLPHWTFKSSSCKFNHLCFQISYFVCVPKTGICTRSDTAPSKSSLLKAKITKIFWKWKKRVSWAFNELEQYYQYSNLNVHLNHSLSNEGGAKKCPKGDKEVATGDACQVEQWVWDAGGGNRGDVSEEKEKSRIKIR